jgi:site-specific DNA recombinase
VLTRLNARAVSGPKEKGWSKNGIYGILNNEIYTGTLVWGRNSKRGLDPIRVENTCPVIVDHETFDRVQEMLHDRAPAQIHPRRTASRFLLSGLTHCGYYGKALIGRDAKSGKFSYYVCGTLDKKGAGACPSRYLNSQKFESLVVEEIKKHILTEDNLTRLVRLVNGQMDKASGEYRDELKLISREEGNISARLDKLYDAVETGKIGLDDLTPRIRELRNRQEQLLSRRSELETLMSDRKVELADLGMVKDYLGDLRQTIDENPLSERRAFIRSFVEDIIVTKKEVQLIYNESLLPGGLTEERVGVLPIVRYGGR